MSKTNITNDTIDLQDRAAVLPEWMNFPTLSAAFNPSPSATIDCLQAKHKEYQALETKGMAADRLRARLIAASYARTHALLQELETARTKHLREQRSESAAVR